MKEINLKKVIFLIVMIIVIIVVGIVCYIKFTDKEMKDNNIIATENNNTIKTQINNEVNTTTENNKSKFSYDDLIINKLKYGMTEKEVFDIMGEPGIKEESPENTTNIYGQSIDYFYGELRINFLLT